MDVEERLANCCAAAFAKEGGEVLKVYERKASNLLRGGGKVSLDINAGSDVRPKTLDFQAPKVGEAGEGERNLFSHPSPSQVGSRNARGRRTSSSSPLHPRTLLDPGSQFFFGLIATPWEERGFQL